MPENSVIFTCWLIVDSRSGVITFGNGGSGLDRIDGMINNSGLSGISSASDCVIDDCVDKESEDAVGEDMAVINGVTVSAWEHAVKRLLKRGCDFHASVKVGFRRSWTLASDVNVKPSQLLCSCNPSMHLVYLQ